MAVTEHPLIEHRRIASGDAELHYVVAGGGECVVLLHGFPETWLAWRKVVPPLAGRYRIIAPDLRGLGESSRPKSGYDKKTVARDVQAVIDAEAVSRYHLVGADMGASVAFPLAMEHEDQVRSFVFISSGLAGVGLERLYDYSTIGVNAWYWTLFQHETFGPLLTAGRVEELLTTWAYRGSALNPDAISDEIIKEYLSHYATTDGWRAALQYYLTLGTDAADNRRYLADGRLLQMPTLGIDGEQDGRLSTATLAQVAVNIRGTLIPQCKHWIAEEQPQRLAAVLLDFFAATAADQAPSRMPRQEPERRATDVATVRADAGVVTYVQVWSVADASAQQQWLGIMRENIHLLRAKPGFVSMTLHSSIDGTRLAVYAQWSSKEALEASLLDPEATAAHDRMAHVGEPHGSLYIVEDVYGPSAPWDGN